MPTLPRFVARSAPGKIRGYSPKVAKLADPTEVRDVVSRLTYGYCDPMSGAPQVASRRTVRLDRQPNAGSGDNACANLHVQVNDAANPPPGAGTTIGQVLVPAAVYLVAHLHPQRNNLLRQLERVVRGALIRSASGGNGTWYVIDVV